MIWALGLVTEKHWEYSQPLFIAFLDLEKAFDRVPREKLWMAMAYVIEQVDANEMIIELTRLFCPCLDRSHTHVDNKWRLLVWVYVLNQQFATKY